MRISIPLAWLLLVLSFFTAGLLRQFNAGTPRSPYTSPIVGSLLFAAVFLLLLVAAREWRRGAVPGRGIRLGSLTPILLMLLGEKWISITLYPPAFYALTRNSDAPGALLDAQYRTLAGFGMLLVCLLVARFSTPTARKAWRRARPMRWPAAAIAMLGVLAGTYLLLASATWALGGGLRLHWPEVSPILFWVLGGQAVLAFAEELYYRGLLLSEMERLAPRLGARKPAARRWVALLTTSVLFGMEHLRLSASAGEVSRQLVFTICLGTLFGLLVTLSANLHFAAGMHAWINWLLLGAAPYFVDESGAAALPAGTYIGVGLILAFVLAYVTRRVARPARHADHTGGPSGTVTRTA